MLQRAAALNWGCEGGLLGPCEFGLEAAGLVSISQSQFGSSAKSPCEQSAARCNMKRPAAHPAAPAVPTPSAQQLIQLIQFLTPLYIESSDAQRRSEGPTTSFKTSVWDPCRAFCLLKRPSLRRSLLIEASFSATKFAYSSAFLCH